MPQHQDFRLVLFTNQSPHAAYAAGRLFAALPDKWAGMINVQPQGASTLLKMFRLSMRGVPLRLIGHKALETVYAAVHRKMIPHRAPGKFPLDVERVASCFDVPFIRTTDANSNTCLAQVRKWRPDCIVSFLCPQILGKPLLDLARTTALNFHPSLLPKNRGMFPLFHTIAARDAKAGVTIHIMDHCMDHGAIVAQKPLPIADDESVLSLFEKCVRNGVLSLLAAIDMVQDKTLNPREQDETAASYAPRPDRATYRRFRRNGGKLGSSTLLRGILDRYSRELFDLCGRRQSKTGNRTIF